MRTNMLLLFILLLWGKTQAQEVANGSRTIPINVTIFSHAVGLPGFSNLFRNPRLGIKIGTEFYYRQRDNHALLQTLNIGYYRHKRFQDGLFISSEFGYRKHFGAAYADVTIGAGYLLIKSALPRYEPDGDGYRRCKDIFGRIMPTLGLGAGYRFNDFTVFSRYEIFGETPFGFKGLPALPHKSLHVGTRFHINR